MLPAIRDYLHAVSNVCHQWVEWAWKMKAMSYMISARVTFQFVMNEFYHEGQVPLPRPLRMQDLTTAFELMEPPELPDACTGSVMCNEIANSMRVYYERLLNETFDHTELNVSSGKKDCRKLSVLHEYVATLAAYRSASKIDKYPERKLPVSSGIMGRLCLDNMWARFSDRASQEEWDATPPNAEKATSEHMYCEQLKHFWDVFYRSVVIELHYIFMTEISLYHCKEQSQLAKPGQHKNQAQLREALQQRIKSEIAMIRPTIEQKIMAKQQQQQQPPPPAASSVPPPAPSPPASSVPHPAPSPPASSVPPPDRRKLKRALRLQTKHAKECSVGTQTDPNDINNIQTSEKTSDASTQTEPGSLSETFRAYCEKHPTTVNEFKLLVEKIQETNPSFQVDPTYLAMVQVVNTLSGPLLKAMSDPASFQLFELVAWCDLARHSTAYACPHALGDLFRQATDMLRVAMHVRTFCLEKIHLTV